MVDRKDFGPAIEGKPLEMRRMSYDELPEGCKSFDCPVGIYRISLNPHKNGKLLAVVDFDDIFDATGEETGNRFNND